MMATTHADFSYLFYSSIFFFVWVILFVLRPDLRRRMLFFSLIIMPLGPISEIWFLKDYWRRSTITGYPISIEDVIFSFAIGGIAFSIYKTFFNITMSRSQEQLRRGWLVVTFPAVMLSFLFFFTNILHLNSIFSSSFAFLVVAILIYILRPDLVKASLVTGLLVLTLFIFIYKIMQMIFPSELQHWCFGCNPSGLVLSGINIEELLWDFSWGLVGGVIYEAARGKELEKLHAKSSTKYSSFDTFNTDCDDTFLKTLNSTYGQFMATSSKNVLSIRLIRELCYRLYKTLNHQMKPRTAIVLLPFVPLLLNLILYPFGLSTKGYFTGWLLYSFVMNYCLLLFPQITWSKLINLSDMVDALLESKDAKEEYIAWMTRRLNLNIQFFLSILGGIIGIVIVLLFSIWSKGRLQLDIASAVSLFFTGSLGINAVYWLWGVPLQIQKLYQFPYIHVTWNDPAATPGIRSQSQLLGYSAILAAIGVVIFVMPLLWFLFSAQLGFVFVEIVNFVAFIASISTVFFIAVFPQYWLSAIVYREKNRILDALEQDIFAEYLKKRRQVLMKWQLLESKVNIYQAIKSTSISTIDIQTLGRYAVAGLTTALPYVIQWLTPKSP